MASKTMSPIEALEQPLTALEVKQAIVSGAFTLAELRQIDAVAVKQQKRQLNAQFPLMSKAMIVHGGRWGGVVGTVVKVNVTTVALSTDRGQVKVPTSLLRAVKTPSNAAERFMTEMEKRS